MVFTSRRRLLTAAGLGALGLAWPRRLRADGDAERKFLFVFCPGGWDVCSAFAPIFNDTTDHHAGDVAAEVGGFQITDGAARPSVRGFFERWGSSTCLINGVQIPSVAHDVCTRLTMTGVANDGLDDWASIVAGTSTADRILPNVHLSGPIYPHKHVGASVRVGMAGQLARLVKGDALIRSDVSVPPVSFERDALEEAWVRTRVDRWAATAGRGEPARLALAEQLAGERAARLQTQAEALEGAAIDLYNTIGYAVRSLAAGLARSGIVAYGQGANGLWDTHSGNGQQEGLFETLFDALSRTLDDLASQPGELAPTLLDETTVVVLSEMGRTPQLNAAEGKDHWTWTSALLIGAGVAGGRTVGAWTEGITGEPVDLASGEAHASGVTLGPGHLGATLLRLAGLDPAEHLDPSLGTPIVGALEDG